VPPAIHPDELINEHIWRAPNAFGARKLVQKNASKRSRFDPKNSKQPKSGKIDQIFEKDKYSNGF
jgi:hypothetical protein